jgi:hypothetical protein
MPKPVPRAAKQGPRCLQSKLAPIRATKPPSSSSRGKSCFLLRICIFPSLAAFVHTHVASVCPESGKDSPKWPSGCPNQPSRQPNKAQDGPSLPHLLRAKTLFLFMFFAYVQVWLPLFTLILHRCVQKLVMTHPSGPMDAQTDPQSNPPRPRWAQKT